MRINRIRLENNLLTIASLELMLISMTFLTFGSSLCAHGYKIGLFLSCAGGGLTGWTWKK